jgi:hypothetical protein
VFVSTLAIPFHETPNPLSLELRVRNSCVEGRKVKSFNAI